MSHLVSLTLTNTATGEQEHVKGEIPDDSWIDLMRFVGYSDELRKTRLVREGASVRARIRWEAGSGLSYQGNLPDPDDTLAFLMRLRPFLLDDERTYFYRICNVLSRHLAQQDVRLFLKQQRALFSGDVFRAQVLMTSNDVVLNSEATLKKWLNAFEYHRDHEKQEELRSLHQLLPLESFRPIFVTMIFDKAKAILEVAQVIRFFMGEGEELILHL